jgi:hypothetical protein
MNLDAVEEDAPVIENLTRLVGPAGEECQKEKV